MKKTKQPAMADKEIVSAVAARTSIPFNTVLAIIAAYQDIIKLCISQGVEVKIGDLGTFGWRVKDPHYGVVYYNIQTGEDMEPIDVPGFWIPKFKPKKTWRTALRKQTEFWDDKKQSNREVEEDEETDAV